MNNDDNEDASLNPLTPEAVIKKIGNSIDGRYEFEIMESETTNKSTNRIKKES